jgi:hypothetical protein
MRFSAVSPSTSTVMQAPEKIKIYSLKLGSQLNFIVNSSQRRTFIRRKKPGTRERCSCTRRMWTEWLTEAWAKRKKTERLSYGEVIKSNDIHARDQSNCIFGRDYNKLESSYPRGLQRDVVYLG